MTQHNLTQILKVIRDLVMRNRPCYRDYLGSETTTNTVQIGAGTFEDKGGLGVMANCPVTDSAFTGFILGETYTVTLDGVTADYVARNLSPISEKYGPVIGTATTFDTENNTSDGWLAAAPLQDGAVSCAARTYDTSFVGKTISISQTKTETVERYNTKLLPEYLLPAFLRKNVVASKSEVQSAAATATAAADVANTAQTTADAAQTAADSALSTANTAKSTADNAKTTADAAQADVSVAKIMSETVTNSTNVVFKNQEMLSSGSYEADGTTRYWIFSSSVLIGSQITFKHPGGEASGIWNGKKLTLKVPHSTGEKTVIFSLLPKGRGMIIKIPDSGWSTNLGLWYSWTEVVYWQNSDDIGAAAIIPDYAIASGFRMISTTGNKQFHLTVDDTGSLTTESDGVEKTTGTYSKPSGGIPKTDLSDEVQASLGKADTALQTAPVTSVNGKTGAVSLGAGDVGAISTANGAVGSSNLADNIPYTKFGLAAEQVRKITFGTAAPSGGSNGDIYIKYS